VIAPVMANGRNHESLSGKSPNPFPKRRPGWSVSGRSPPTALAPV
jgi:hypothetical protein